MSNQELLSYINQQLARGVSKRQIKEALLYVGWPESDIDQALSAANNGSDIPVPNSAPATKQSPQDLNRGALPGATDLLRGAWDIYKKKIGTFLGIMIAPSLAGLVLTVAGDYFLKPESGPPGIFLNNPILVGVTGFVFVVLIVIIQLWSYLALVYAAKDSQENAVGVLDSYKKGVKRIHSFLWLSVLTTLILLGGFILFFIPGLIFTVWFSLAVFVFVIENEKGMGALLKSKEYVRGFWGGVFWRFLFIMILLGAITAIPILILTILKVPLGDDLAQFLAGLFLAPLGVLYGFLIYKNLKNIKGEFYFSPTTGQKAKFIIVGILGLLLIPAITFSEIFFGFKNSFEDAYNVEYGDYENGSALDGGSENAYPIYCGADHECFLNASRSCTPAEAVITEQGLTYAEKIEGYEGDSCVITLTYIDSPITEIIGKEMACRIPASGLDDFRSYLQDEEGIREFCEGSLVDYLNQNEL